MSETFSNAVDMLEALHRHNQEQRAKSIHENPIRGIKERVKALRSSIHAVNRNPIPNSSRRAWRDMCDELLDYIDDVEDNIIE